MGGSPQHETLTEMDDVFAETNYPTMDALFEPEITAMHGVAASCAAHGRQGRLWTIDANFGEGYYWYYAINDHAAMASLQVSFKEPVVLACNTCDFLCLGSYGRAAVPCFNGLQNISADSPSDRTLLGYAWRRKPFAQTTRADVSYDITSLVMRPAAVKAYAQRCGCDVQRLSQAITSLDGTRDVVGLNAVFAEIRQARPAGRWARAYYDAKAVEALCLLLDWDEAERKAGHKAEIKPEDRKALATARDHIAANLERPIGTDELCQVTFVSKSKLLRLFKQAEGMTPQEYARELRMERACQLLEEGNATMAQVASSLGFSRQGSFSEAFKKRYGVPPNDYRMLRVKTRA